VTKSAKNQTLVMTWGRLVLGAFVFAWLNAAAQPCLMAKDMTVEPEMAPAHAAHGMHQDDLDAIDTGDCGHCPPSGAGIHQDACATMQAADCTELPISNLDVRQLKFELKDVPGMFAVSQAPPQTILAGPKSVTAPRTCKRLRFSHSPPLNLRYCVFLK
jgi:hypothetical protein